MRWVKVFTREFPFLPYVFVAKGYREYQKKIIGVGFSEILGKIENGIMTTYRKEDEIKAYFKQIEKKKKDKKFIDKFSENFREQIKKLRKAVEEVKSTPQSFLNLGEIYAQFWAYYLFTFYAEMTELRKISSGVYDYAHEGFLKILEKLDQKVELLMYATPSEIIELMKNKKIDEKILENRRKKCVFLIHNEKNIEFFYGEEADKMARKVEPESFENVDILKGNVAYGEGKIRGKVVVVFRAEDAKNAEGKILVAPATQPSFTPYLKKVKAIITDEGGITSHAAIVSRELKIPCIVGTKIATKVLKNGDKIEINFEKKQIRKGWKND